MTNNTRISVLEQSVETLGEQITALLSALEGNVPNTAKKGSKAGSKASTKAKGTKAAPKGEVRYLTRKNQAAFKRTHKWAQGLSVNAIAEAVVAGEQELTGPWAIGEGRKTKVLTGEFGTPSVGTKSAAKAKKSSAKKGSKAKGRKGTRQVAKVDANAPAKVRPADGPRDAMGRITPRSEWALRESLAETGKFDRHEIDAAVAAQV